MQALDAPSKIKKGLITNKATATFMISLCTSIAYMSFPRVTDFSRIKGLAGLFLRAFYPLQAVDHRLEEVFLFPKGIKSNGRKM